MIEKTTWFKGFFSIHLALRVLLSVFIAPLLLIESVKSDACIDYHTDISSPALAGISRFKANTTNGKGNFGAHWVGKGLAVDVYQLLNGAQIYQSETVYVEDKRPEKYLSELRRSFGSHYQKRPAGGGQRTANGYSRAEFQFDAQRCGLPKTGAATPDSKFAAVTQWYVVWGWYEGAATLSSSGRYRLDGEKLYANISSMVTLPVWQPPYDTSARDRQTWSSFSCALAAHENLHVESSRIAARRTLQEATKLTADTPEELYAQLECLWQYGLSWANNEDKRIDLFTGHGPRL